LLGKWPKDTLFFFFRSYSESTIFPFEIINHTVICLLRLYYVTVSPCFFPCIHIFGTAIGSVGLGNAIYESFCGGYSWGTLPFNICTAEWAELEIFPFFFHPDCLFRPCLKSGGYACNRVLFSAWNSSFIPKQIFTETN
jgi:uncharacterized membrane protein YwaF